MPSAKEKEFQDLIEAAENVLKKNWTGSFTKPTNSLYPHQWSWDSCFISIGYCHYNQERAEKELERLFDAQWDNGMIPHIVFDKNELNGLYFPGPDFWQVDCSPDSPAGLKCSGICQPPVHATAVRLMMDHSKDTKRALDYAEKIYDQLVKWHNYLYDERDPEDEK